MPEQVIRIPRHLRRPPGVARAVRTFIYARLAPRAYPPHGAVALVRAAHATFASSTASCRCSRARSARYVSYESEFVKLNLFGVTYDHG